MTAPIADILDARIQLWEYETQADWQPISTVPCDDTFVRVRWKDGSETTEEMDHDSDPDWWAERGATHWRPTLDGEAIDVCF
jgi:hypothetical protein